MRTTLCGKKTSEIDLQILYNNNNNTYSIIKYELNKLVCTNNIIIFDFDSRLCTSGRD